MQEVSLSDPAQLNIILHLAYFSVVSRSFGFSGFVDTISLAVN